MAFQATMQDAAFLRDATKAGLEVNWSGHVKVEDILKQLFSSPPAVVERMRKTLDLR